MTIKELKRILTIAPDQNRKIYIASTSGRYTTTEIHWNFDDNNDLELTEGTNRK